MRNLPPRLLGILAPWCLIPSVSSFSPHSTTSLGRSNLAPGTRKVAAFAAPARLADNTEGVLYVNDKCIDCSACQYFAPTVFGHSDRHGKHVVRKQPDGTDQVELDRARAALSACPVAAIRVENSATFQHKGEAGLSAAEEELAKKLAINEKLNGLSHPFPRPLTTNVWYVGHHNDKSFGATPYVVRGGAGGTTVMVDTPKFGPSAVRTVQSICGDDGPDYLFLSHVDDTAHHLKWRERFPKMKRIFHEGDLGVHNWLGDETLEDVEVLLRGSSTGLEEHDASSLKAWRLDGSDCSLVDDGGTPSQDEFVIVHTPGHSPGSITLLYRPAGGTKCTIFTGDTLAFSSRVNGLSGFPQYGNNLKLQADTLQTLLDLPRLGYDWDVIAPGHGRYQKYGDAPSDVRDGEVVQAAEYLRRFR